MKAEHAFLGKGWSFPPNFEKRSKGVTMVADEKDIRQSLEILLNTSLKERVMRPDFGCNLRDYLFEPMNNSIRTFLANLIETAILYYEPRIKVNRIELSTERQTEGILSISIDYTIRNTNSRFNWVYPFYLKEVTGLESV